MNTTDALSAGIFAMNTLLHPDASTDEDMEWLDMHAGEAIDTLCGLRETSRGGDMVKAAVRAAALTLDGRGDELVTLPRGTDVAGAQHDDGVTAVAAIDLIRHMADSYDLSKHWSI